MRSSARKFSNFYSSAPVTASLFICAGKYAILGAAPFPLCGTILTQDLLRSENSEVSSMNILFIGCDQVGAALVRDLEHIGHDISLIEKDSEQLKRLDSFDDYNFGGTALVV